MVNLFLIIQILCLNLIVCININIFNERAIVMECYKKNNCCSPEQYGSFMDAAPCIGQSTSCAMLGTENNDLLAVANCLTALSETCLNSLGQCYKDGIAKLFPDDKKDKDKDKKKDLDKDAELIYNRTIEFLQQNEGNKSDIYVPCDKNGKAVGNSGATIGTGIDIGQHSIYDINQWNISDELKNKLAPYALLKQQEAVDFVKSHPLKLKDDEVKELNKAVITSRIKILIKDYDANSNIPFVDLPIQAQKVIVSVNHNFVKLKNSAPKFWNQITHQDWKSASNELKDWNNGKFDPIAGRRKHEASVLDELVQTK